MRKAIQQLLERKSLYLAFGITFAIGYLSLTKLTIGSFGLPASFSDKILHIVAYAVLSFFWFLTIDRKNWAKRYFSVAFVALLLYGVLLEYLQMKLTTYRFGNFLDIVANTTGVVFAAVFCKLVYFRYP
jgi:hypothetical protein